MPTWTKEQQQAIDEEGKNIIVSAGAGSGKTAVLTNRVLRKIKNGISIQNLLILTFTNKAATEMRDRIKKILKEENEQEQLDYIDSAFITTFDSFTLFLVRKYYYLLSIPKNISIADPTIINLKKEELLDQIFMSFYEKKEEKFEKLITHFCVKDDKEIKEAALKIYQKITMKPNYLEYIDVYMKEFFDENKIDNFIREYEDLLKRKREDIEEYLEELKYLTTGEYYYKIVDTLKDFFEARTYEEIKNCFPIKLPIVPKNSERELIEKKEELTKRLSELYGLLSYDNKENIKNTIEKTKDYVSILLQIIKELDKKLFEFKNEKHLYEFQDIALMGISLLKKDPEIKEELKTQFKEIMIDEYQDTNDLQEAFIQQIADNNVYMVGDIKQSIYRFRNANPKIFKDKYDLYTKEKGGIKIDLNKNFRSRKEVIEDINFLFNILMDNEIGGANYEKEHQMLFGNNTYEKEENGQNHHLELYQYPFDNSLNYKKEEIEAFLIAEDILNRMKRKESIVEKEEGKLRQIDYCDFVILMDRTTDFELYKKIFEYKKIPLTIEKDENITEEKDMIVLKNLYHLIIEISKNSFSKEFHYYFLSIGRSFLFPYKDQELFEMFLKEDFKNNELYQKAYKISQKIPGMTSYEILQTILDEYSFYEKIITIGNVSEAFVRVTYFLELAKNLSDQGYTPTMFDEYLKKINQSKLEIRFSLNKESQNSVKIMTIHKSKGLEYPICYYAGIYKEFNQADIKEKFLYDTKYGIVTPYFEEGICPTIYKELLKNSYKLEEISEKLRLFYVALTRSREKMIFVLPKWETINTFKKSALFHCHSFLDFLKIMSDKLAPYQKEFEIEKINLSKEYLLLNQESEVENFPQQKSLEVSEWKEKNIYIEEKTFSKKKKELLNKEKLEYMHLGKWFHEQFEYLDFNNPKVEMLDLPKEYKKYLTNFLEQSIIKNGDFKNVFHEHEFIYHHENQKYHGIIDLVLEKEQEVIVIDYKLQNILDDEYDTQLLGYKKYIEDTWKKPTKMYLYSILTNQMIER